MLTDFTPTAETISLHGLGFIQVKLPNKARLHVWHPDLPRRKCFDWSAIHNHRFAFRSTVLIGEQVNRRWDMKLDPDGGYVCISHDGARTKAGGRPCIPVGNVEMIPRHSEFYTPGMSYDIAALEYHDTPNAGVVVTLMEKREEGAIHACSIIRKYAVFDDAFDRFQLPPKQLWEFVADAFERQNE